MISVTEQSTGLKYRATTPTASTPTRRGAFAAQHVVHYRRPRRESGLQLLLGIRISNQRSTRTPNSYRFNNGVPNQHHACGRGRRDDRPSSARPRSVRAGPVDGGALTISAGMRFDDYAVGYPERAGRADAAHPDTQHHVPGAEGVTRSTTSTPRVGVGLRPVRRREDGAEGQRQQVPRGLATETSAAKRIREQPRQLDQRGRGPTRTAIRSGLRADRPARERRVRRDG